MAKEATNEIPKVPFSVCDRGAFVRKHFIACEIVSVPTFECVVYSIAYDRVEMMHIPVSEMGRYGDTKATQFYVDGDHVMGGPAQLVKTHLQWLRNKALESGATPDAIRLLGRATKPFTKKEEVEMAEKLKSKSAPKAGNAAALKKAAAKTPVGGAKAAKPKGNADALRKAREAKGPDLRKIKPLIKAKDIAAREGTYRHQMVSDLIASKTVAEFRAKNEKYHAGDLRYAVDAGIVSIA